MGSFSIWHWMIVLLIVVLVFGTKRLRGAGGDLGAAVKNFKSSMKEGEAEADRHTEALRGDRPPGTTTTSTSTTDKHSDHV